VEEDGVVAAAGRLVLEGRPAGERVVRDLQPSPDTELVREASQPCRQRPPLPRGALLLEDEHGHREPRQPGENGARC